MAASVEASAGSGAITVDCPIVHQHGLSCWLCGSRSRSRISVWVFEQWVRLGRPLQKPSKETK
jgi:hypothetical protein